MNLAQMFLNPGFLFVAAALISVPIIIHLINRMRFKRIRWGAMEFLLKALKRTKRRLIIEQLLLLALRCLLLALVGFLVSRFIGCSESNLGGKPNLHLVLLDDTLSMQDTWKQDGEDRNCFDNAKRDILIKKIAKGVAANKTNDRLVVLPMSKIDDAEEYVKLNRTYENLNDKNKFDAMAREIEDMKPSMLHKNMLQGVKAAQQIMANYTESAITLYIISDLRSADWSNQNGAGLMAHLVDLVKKNKDVKIKVVDTAYPLRKPTEPRPDGHPNFGIVDFRPSTRIVGDKVPVKFTVAIQNFTKASVQQTALIVRDENTGQNLMNVDFDPPNPISLSPNSTTYVTFERGDVKSGYFFDETDGEELRKLRPFAHLSVRLADPSLAEPLSNDGLHADNIRHAVVEVRETVPILVIDGNQSTGRDPDKDSFMLANAAMSPPGKSYKVEFGDVLMAGDHAVKALERSDLSKYPIIYLLNVPSLNADQKANLENYVREGGGVAFFMGPNVNAAEYNKLYNGGKGVFPAPLSGRFFFPSSDLPEIPTKEGETFQLITREDQFPKEKLPIFSAMFVEPRQKDPFRYLPIHRYWKVDRAAWKSDPGRVFELATLPNEDEAAKFEPQIASIVNSDAMENVRKLPEFKDKYGSRFNNLVEEVKNRAKPGSEFKAYQLAESIERVLSDKGQKGVTPDMTEFWANVDSNADVERVREQFKRLFDQVHYGDPFVIGQHFGKGKVIAVMSTAGKDWNEWSGGSPATVTYPMFIWELQNYLSSPGAEGNLLVGSDLNLTLDAKQFEGKQLKLVRNFRKLSKTGPATLDSSYRHEPKQNLVDGKFVFSLTKNDIPGVYTAELFDDPAATKPIAQFAHAFNVDTLREGDLDRADSAEIDRDLVARSEGSIAVVQGDSPEGKLMAKQNDMSESPWLYLIILLVLVAEQALAVHLSFHLKNTENEAAPAVAKA